MVEKKITPMMQQYFAIKEQYSDCLLFYRLGDFYELFYDDAKKAAQLLEIALTSRNKHAEDPIPMCGVPHHSAKEYIRTLIELGYKVALCEQVEDPKLTKGMVKREVVQVITPGTYTDYSSQHHHENHYLAAVIMEASQYYLTYVDISTGELKGVALTTKEALKSELSSLPIKEIVVETEEVAQELADLVQYFGLVQTIHEFSQQEMKEYESLLTEVTSKSLVSSFYLLLDYLVCTQKRSFSHLQQAVEYEAHHFLKINHEAKQNLELTAALRTHQKYGSLFWFLDETKTAMGTRLLKQWIEKPLILQTEIETRHALVKSMSEHFFETADIVDVLKSVYDLERIVGKVSFGSANARDLLQLRYSLEKIPTLRLLVEQLEEEHWHDVLIGLDPIPELQALIEEAIDEDAQLTITDGKIIRDGYSDVLDDYRDAMQNGKQWIANLQQKEREATGIKTLKIGFNKVFGYYIEVTKANIPYLDESRYDRKQTLANAERYITPELKEYERIILEAEEKSVQLEYELFVEVRDAVKQYTSRLQQLAISVASLDVLQSFATVSTRYQLVQPVMSMEDRTLEIIDGRHPVVEKVMGKTSYVPNSITMAPHEQLLLITGPNMSGKSTYMRQLALCVILAQMGCFVPASSAKMPIFTKIFTRIGAADDLTSGQSTFMVEMLETNTALQQADKYSLLLFDEIGRGTATYDGMALAEAILTYIHDHIPAKTLFSTHYHELTALSKRFSSLRNVHVGASEKNGEVVFLHKIMEGPADKSYGIHVAKLAGMPKELLTNATHILKELETQTPKQTTQPEQLSLFEENSLMSLQESELLSEIRSLNLMSLTPLEVMMLVAKWQKELE